MSIQVLPQIACWCAELVLFFFVAAGFGTAAYAPFDKTEDVQGKVQIMTGGMFVGFMCLGAMFIVLSVAHGVGL